MAGSITRVGQSFTQINFSNMLALNIARRYFFSKHKKQFINLISIISLLVVLVGTAALVITLSVFNGLEGVIKGLHSTFNADLQVQAKLGKSFKVDSDFLKKIKSIEGVDLVSEIIEDNALLRYRDGQMVVTIKGVSDNFLEQSNMASTLVYGEFKLREGQIPLAVLGHNIQGQLGINLGNRLDPIQIWYPRRSQKINLSNLNPENNFNRKSIYPSGVFSLEQTYDGHYVFAPLSFCEALLEYKNRRTALEIKILPESNLFQVQKRLKQTLGDGFLVKTSEEQEASLLKAIQLEKFFVFITLSSILAIASINIFFSLMLLVIDKRKDIAILKAMGADDSFIRRVFFTEGLFISFLGAFLGLGAGIAICLLQQKYGFVTMGTETTIISAYPVALEWGDFGFTLLTISVISALSSYIPAARAAQLSLKENLH